MIHTPKIKGTVRLARLIRPKGHHLQGRLVILHTIDSISAPAQMIGRKRERAGLRGMWYGSDPRDQQSFGKVERGGMIPVGKAGGRIPTWLMRKI